MDIFHVILIVIVVMYASERIAKLIPDSKTGPLGVVRKVFKTIALYTENVR
jgi:hypothetical protein